MTEGAQRPKVSVCVVTYNQERYIRPCLDSVLSQEAPFPYEVVVGEDCSTDSTRSIVEDYARRYASHLAHFLALKPEHGIDILCSSFANFIVDVRHGQRTCLAFLPVVARSFSLRGVPVLARHLVTLRRIRKQRLSK